MTADDYRRGYARPLYWYPPVGVGWDMGYYPGYYAEPYAVHTEQNIPGGTVGLKEGTPVVDASGQTVGHLETYIRDAEQEGDVKVVQYFHDVQAQHRLLAQRGKALLVDRLSREK